MTLTEFSSFGITEENLNLPDLPAETLDITIIDNGEVEIEDITESFPLAISEVTTESILDAKLLTHGEDVKEVYSIELSNTFTSFRPGDTIGILTHNREEDVTKLFAHLGISHLVRKKCKITEKASVKKNLPKPVFINKITTLEKIFTYHLDIQCIPKKILIRILAEFTKDSRERRQLEELCSKEKSDAYTKNILEGNKTFLELLLSFPTCCPPVARLVENLPKLLPRPYSIASSPLASDKIQIVFSVIESKNGLVKEGLCSGMLKKLIKDRGRGNSCVKLFFRKCNGFNLPEVNVPLILVGPGTGIAPFMGFLEHRKMQGTQGKIWMFYGCRYKSRDYLFEKELQEYLSSGLLTKLCVSFSRDGESVKYVQDNIRKFGREICDLVVKENAMIYVCGDARNMKKDVQNAFVDVFEKEEGMSNKEAADLIKKLQKEKKYLTDIWL